MKRKSRFSFIEILLFLTILAAVSGVIGWQTFRLVNHYRFGESVQKLKQTIIHLQLAALTYGSDHYLEIYRENETWKVCPKSNEAQFRAKSFSLGGVDTIRMAAHQKASVTLRIAASGYVLPAETMELSSKGRTITIDLSVPILVKTKPSLPTS